MPSTTPNEQETFDCIMGSGATMYGWYLHSETNGAAEAAYASSALDIDVSAVAGWAITYAMEDPDKEGKIEVKINHKAILDACRKMVDGGLEYVTHAAGRNARALLSNPDDADFDANSADEVLQLIAYGRIVFG